MTRNIKFVFFKNEKILYEKTGEYLLQFRIKNIYINEGKYGDTE